MHMQLAYTYMFIKGPGERCHECPPGGPRDHPHKERAYPSLPESGQQGMGDTGEGLGLQLHPGLDDISWLGGGGGQQPRHQATWQRIAGCKLVHIKNCKGKKDEA